MSIAPSACIPLAHALKMVPTPDGERSELLFERGSLRIKLYAPKGTDPQTPHRQDEVYVVARGRGVFWDGADNRAVEPGTFLFVGAGMPHRFEDFTDDFAVWVMYYGPDGGEAAQLR